MRCSLHLASGFAFYIAGDQTEFLGALVQTSGRSGDDDLVFFGENRHLTVKRPCFGICKG